MYELEYVYSLRQNHIFIKSVMNTRTKNIDGFRKKTINIFVFFTFHSSFFFDPACNFLSALQILPQVIQCQQALLMGIG